VPLSKRIVDFGDVASKPTLLIENIIEAHRVEDPVKIPCRSDHNNAAHRGPAARRLQMAKELVFNGMARIVQVIDIVNCHGPKTVVPEQGQDTFQRRELRKIEAVDIDWISESMGNR
jgi:hypothetical protein